MAELIVALDVQTRAEAEAKVKLLGDSVDFYKIGLELFSAEGPDVVKAVKGSARRCSWTSSSTTFRARWSAPC